MMLLSALALSLLLQATDFSGQWTADPPAEKAPGDMGSGWGSPLTITQDARQLIVEQALFSRYDLQPPVKSAVRTRWQRVAQHRDDRPRLADARIAR